MFAGWELMGVSSALFIGFYRERAEPARSSLRAFATYRMCDVGFLLAVVATHELIGSTRISALASAAALPRSLSGRALPLSVALLRFLGRPPPPPMAFVVSVLFAPAFSVA